MLKSCKLSFVYFSMLWLLFFTIADKLHAQKQSLPQKNIMVLHGEWQLWKWGKTFDSALYNRMYAQNDLDLRVTFEFLGLEFIDQGVYPQEVIETLRYKIQKTPLDLVIAVLPQANEFLLSYGQKVFPGVPKIFALPDGVSLGNISNLSDSVVISSSSESALEITVERIFSILPETEELLVVCGNSPHDLTYLKIAKEAIATHHREITTSYFVGEPLDQLLPKVSNLPKNAVILFLTYGKDTNNKKIVSAVAISQISERANVPIFGFYDSLLGRGIVGGNLSSAGQYGKKTAELGLRLIRGEQASSVPLVKNATVDIYDWRQLKRWNISEDRLPSGSIIRYKTETLWEAHKAKIIMALLFICIQTIFIFVLIITLRRKHKTENDLRESEKQLQNHRDHLEVLVEERTIKIKKTHRLLRDSKDLLDAAGKMAKVGGWELDAKTLEVKWTKQTYRIHELPLDHQPPLDKAINFFQKEDREKLSTAIQRALDHGEPYDMEIRLITAKGKKLWTRTVCNPQVINGKTSKLKGILQDITEHKQMEEALRDSKDRLHGLIQNIQAGVVVHGIDTKIKDCNKAALELLGLTEDQAFGKKAIDPSWRFYNEDGSDMPLERYPVNQVITSKNELKNMIVGIYRPDRDDIVKALTNAVPGFDSDGNIFEVIVTFVDITDRIQAANARETILKSLQEALDNVKTLSGLVPICSSCKKIRDDKGYWNQIEAHIQKHTSAEFSHGICPECSDALYGDEEWYINMKKNKKKE